MNIKIISIGACLIAAGAASAHNIIPTPQEYKELGGVSTSDKIEFALDASMKPEAYALTVTKDGTKVIYADAAGKFYATKTLEQLKTEEGYPCVEIKDWPHCRFRGIHIDESRHFFGKATILKLLDLMGRYKLNVLVWHLNDDRGFRQPFPFDPLMATKGATTPFSPVQDVKSKTVWDPNPNVAQEAKGRDLKVTGPDYGPFSYTVEEVKEVLAAAKARSIRVIPVLEVPGHATGVIRAHPDFACLDQDGNQTPPGMEICVGNPDAIAWYDKAFDWTMELFEDEYIHIAGDEVNPRKWNNCPRCQKFMNDHGMKEWQDLQKWITKRYADRLRAKGRKIACWDDVYMMGDCPKDALIFCPNGLVAGSAAAEGYQVVRADNCVYYIDWPQGLRHDPCQYIAWKPEENTFHEIWLQRIEWDLPEKFQPNVQGACVENWAEFTRSPEELEWKLWPRCLALADNLWKHGGNPISGRYAEFRQRAEKHNEGLKAQGVNAAPFAPDPLTEIKGLVPEHVALEVADPEAMADWWCKNLGFKVTMKAANRMFIADASGVLAFELYPPAPGKAAVDYHQLPILQLHFGFFSEDPVADRDRLMKAGATCEAEDDAPGLKGYMLRDPRGIPFQVMKRAKSVLE